MMPLLFSCEGALIYGKTLVRKWLGTVVGFPILAAILAGVMQLIQ